MDSQADARCRIQSRRRKVHSCEQVLGRRKHFHIQMFRHRLQVAWPRKDAGAKLHKVSKSYWFPACSAASVNATVSVVIADVFAVVLQRCTVDLDIVS